MAFEQALSFPDQSASFVHGFEAGGIWARMKTETADIEAMTHIENRELIDRMAAIQGWEVTRDEADGWDVTRLAKIASGPAN